MKKKTTYKKGTGKCIKAFVEPFFLLSTFKRFQQFSVGVLDECFLTLVVLEVPQPVENLYFQPVGHQHLFPPFSVWLTPA